jgi:hypothetical protein
MPGCKQTALAALTVTLVCTPITPAAAAGPLLIAPLLLGHVIGAMARVAALPFVAASSRAWQQAPAYAAASGYDRAPPGYYHAPSNYYAQPPVSYVPASRYYAGPQSYFRPAPSYAQAMPRYYPPARGDYAPRARYSGAYGAHVPYRSNGFVYRRR